MKSKLRQNERCPLHAGTFWCECKGPRPNQRKKPLRSRLSRGKPVNWRYMGSGVWQIPDDTHPRLYREFRNAESLRRVMNQKITDQDGRCGICGDKFINYAEITWDHIEPKGMGGAQRDDHPDNIQAAHHWPCNVDKGSKRA